MRLSAIEPERFPWFDWSRYSFSLGVASGDVAFLSGHSASQYDSEKMAIVVNGGVEDQTRVAYQKIAALLEAAGIGFSDVIHVVENVRSDRIVSYPEIEMVRKEIFGEFQPSVSTICVKALLRPTAAIEIEVTARISSNFGQGSSLAFSSSSFVRTGENAIAEDLVFLPTMLPIDENGEVLYPGDLQGQTQVVFEKARSALADLGLPMSQIVKTLDYTTPATLQSYRATGAVRKDMLGPIYPAAAGILMPSLHYPGQLIALEVTASRAPLEAINAGWQRYEKLTYSPAVKAGSVLFLSGQGALDPETERALFPGDVVAQAEYIYDNIGKVLKAAGANFSDLVRTVEYVTEDGISGYRAVAGVRERSFTKPYPASTGIICETLLRPEFLIEVDSTAVL